jgi:hypothetical protein
MTASAAQLLQNLPHTTAGISRAAVTRVLGPFCYLCVRAGRTLVACATYRTLERHRGFKQRKGKPKSEAPDRSEAPRSSPGYIRPVRRGGDIGIPRAAVKSSLNWVGPRRLRVPPQGGAVLLEPALLVVRSDFATNQPYDRCRPCIVPRESFIRPGACRPQLAARRAQTKKFLSVAFDS